MFSIKLIRFNCSFHCNANSLSVSKRTSNILYLLLPQWDPTVFRYAQCTGSFSFPFTVTGDLSGETVLSTYGGDLVWLETVLSCCCTIFTDSSMGALVTVATGARFLFFCRRTVCYFDGGLEVQEGILHWQPIWLHQSTFVWIDLNCCKDRFRMCRLLLCFLLRYGGCSRSWIHRWILPCSVWFALGVVLGLIKTLSYTGCDAVLLIQTHLL